MKRILYICLVLCMICMMGCSEKKVKVASLMTEMQENPIDVDTDQPRFSWQIESELENVRQTGYRIQVALSEDDLRKEQNLLWDSGLIESEAAPFVTYDGHALLGESDYYWRVRLTTNQGETPWSDVAKWSVLTKDTVTVEF